MAKAKLRGGALLAHSLKEKGVDHVFTLAGGFCNPALEGFMECQMPVINTPHEQIAGHLADGHARIHRKPTVCLVGPEGFANAVPAMLEAMGERSPVIFITGHGSVSLAVKSMKKGAIDFLEKPFSDEEICRLVDSSLQKARDVSDKKEVNLKAQGLLAKLTPRENQVLERITAGRLNKQIADDLNISIKTVEAHRANIMTKVEARTVAELIKIALTATEGVQAG